VGQSALDTFNKLGNDSRTQTIPAVLLLDEGQAAWKLQAHGADHRVVLSMPLTLKQLRDAIGQLVPARVEAAGG
jgi:eukaryotic-like serine/threonine-protein kinase